MNPVDPQRAAAGTCPAQTPAGGPEAIPAEPGLEGAEQSGIHSIAWSWQQFKDMLRNAVLTRSYPADCPAMLELGPLRPQFEKLRERSVADDRDRLRTGAINRETGEFNLSRRIAVGHYGSTHDSLSSPTVYTTVLDFHTRTPGPLSVAAERLSTLGPDHLRYFLLDTDRLVSAVIAPQVVILALKTEATPRDMPNRSLKIELDKLMEKARARGGLELVPMTLTRLACEKFGLALYSDAECETGQLRRIQ